MKRGNWNSRKAYKKDLNGCHRGAAPMGQIAGQRYELPAEQPSLGAIAMAIAARLMFGWRGNKRGGGR